MKVISLIVLCLGMSVAGYFLYDGIIPLFLKPSSESNQDPLVRSVTFKDNYGTTKTVKLDLNKILPTQYPETVTLTSDTDVRSEDGSLSETIAAGTVVIPRNVQDGKLVIQQKKSSLRGLINFDSSDFESKLALKLSSSSNPAPIKEETTALPAEAGSPPVTPPAPQPKTTSTPATVSIPEATVAPAPSPQSTATPPATIAEGKSSPLNDAQVIELMKQSLKAEQVTEFKTEQVKGWKKEADETIDGETFQVGLAAFEANTIFGTEMLKAKALIKNGKVIRWIWPRSGMNIR